MVFGVGPDIRLTKTQMGECKGFRVGGLGFGLLGLRFRVLGLGLASGFGSMCKVCCCLERSVLGVHDWAGFLPSVSGKGVQRLG